MHPKKHESISRKKVVWGLGRLLPYIKRTIDSSRFIPTEEKDSLYGTIEKAYHQLEDAIKREFGEIPITPSQDKQWRDNINKVRKTRGLEPLKERKVDTKSRSRNPLLDEFIRSILKE